MTSSLRAIRFAMLLALAFAVGSSTLRAASLEQVPTATGGFIPNGGSINTPPPGGTHPSIVLGHLAASDSLQPWVAFERGNDVVVSRFDGVNWQQQGQFLNTQEDHPASQAAIVFAGANTTTPWATFVETHDGVGQIKASHFAGRDWQQLGSGTLSSLNRSATADANHPHVASGSTELGGDPQPWFAWDEATSNGRRVFVSTVAGEVAQPIGAPINVDGTRNSIEPDIAFAGIMPWVVWTEQSSTVASTVFAAQAVADVSSPGGLRWSIVGQQTNCASTSSCALNLHSARNAGSPRIATGTLADETAPAPWVVFTQQSSEGNNQVYVARFEGGRFRFTSGSLNVDPAAEASSPTVFFIGKVPHVAWTEQRGGSQRVFIRHLGSAIPGQERWDLDSDAEGLTRLSQTTHNPAIGSDGNTPYLAWSEGDTTPVVFSDRRFPDGPAWGRNYPPFIRIISGTIRLAQSSIVTADTLREQSPADVISGPVEITSSCDHVNGWDAIREVQFKLSNDQETIFLGRYVAATNQIVVMNLANLDGPPLGSGTPGSGSDIETSSIILHMSRTGISSFGSNAAALDVHWVLSFKESTRFKQYTQSLNIVYTMPASTGIEQNTVETHFFRTGSLFVGNQVWLPIVKR